MSNNYGLVVNNNNGGVMFDSRRGLSSYGVREVGIATSTSTPLADGEFLFAKRYLTSVENSVWWSNKVIVSDTYNHIDNNYGNIANPIEHFYGWIDGGTSSTGTVVRVTMNYFIISHSSNIDISSDSYGLQIKNSDDSIQFDSRAIKLGDHFKIDTYHPPKDVTSNGTHGLDGTVNDWFLMNWTRLSRDIGLVISGLKYSGGVTGGPGPVCIQFSQIGDFGGDEDGYPGGTSPFNPRQYQPPKINSMILGAQLV